MAAPEPVLESEYAVVAPRELQVEPGQGLRDFVARVHALKTETHASGDGFSREFEELKAISASYRRTQRFPCINGQLPYNIKKNRYKDILPFDHSRVILPGTHVEGSDYINASYIAGVDGNINCPSVIAAQGPLLHTVVDFWRMVWSHEVRAIAMCTNLMERGKKKCAKYWPDPGKTMPYGAVTVTHMETRHFEPDFVINVLRAECAGVTRTINHFHYLTWPDHGVPESPVSVMRMLSMIREVQPDDAHPVIIHCSAGCGRTGSLAAIDYIWNLLKQRQLAAVFDVFEVVKTLRQYRQAMVQTSSQHLFVYKAVLDLVKQILNGVLQKPGAGEPALVSESAYVNLTPFVSQALGLTETRKRALSAIQPPTVDDVQSKDTPEDDEDNLAVVDIEAPVTKAMAKKDRVVAPFERDVPSNFDDVDLAYPARPYRPMGPRPPPASWEATKC